MKRRAVLALTIGFLLGADAPKEDEVKRDLGRLQGTWELVGTEAHGVTLKYRRHRLRVEGQELGYVWDAKGSHPVVRRQRFKIDPTARPRAIDVDDEDIRATGRKIPITVPGIYAVEGDTLKLFLNRGGRRPKSFDTAAETGGLYTYRRQQSDGPNKPKGGGANQAGSAERKDMVTTGLVKTIDGTAIQLTGGQRFALDRQTRYAIETGRDPLEARHSAVTPGKRVTIGWRDEGGRRVAVLVLVDRLQPADQVQKVRR